MSVFSLHIFISSYYTPFFFRKIGYTNFIPKLICCLSVCLFVMFLVIVSSPKLLDVATSNFACAKVVLSNVSCDLGQG